MAVGAATRDAPAAAPPHRRARGAAPSTCRSTGRTRAASSIAPPPRRPSPHSTRSPPTAARWSRRCAPSAPAHAQLTLGPLPRSDDDPPADSGTLGPSILPDGLTVTIAFGASLFDDRYGLASRAAAAVTMPTFPNDNLDPARSHGDVLVQLCAGQRDTVAHALRELMRPLRGALQLRWTIDGFSGADRDRRRRARPATCSASATAPATRDAARCAVWCGSRREREPATSGGTYQVVRVIRMHVEFWDRVGLREQENMIGRRRDTGAPLGGTTSSRTRATTRDPKGDRIPLDAHIRTREPAHGRHGGPAHPPARLQLPPRLRRGRAARPGPCLRRLQPGHRAPVRDGSEAAEGRAAGRLRHARRRRLLLRAERQPQRLRLGRVGVVPSLSPDSAATIPARCGRL